MTMKTQLIQTDETTGKSRVVYEKITPPKKSAYDQDMDTLDRLTKLVSKLSNEGTITEDQELEFQNVFEWAGELMEKGNDTPIF